MGAWSLRRSADTVADKMILQISIGLKTSAISNSQNLTTRKKNPAEA